MKRLVVFLLLLIGIVVFFWFRSENAISPLSLSVVPTESPTQYEAGEAKTSLFVPYWSLSSGDFSDEDVLIYFGVTPGNTGVNTDDPGYRGLSVFQDMSGGRTAYLTLRMLDSKQNFAILESETRQKALIKDTLRIAKEQGFDGVVLDLEVSALPFASLLDQISAFNNRFYSEAKRESMHYAVALYGDTFFRIRPFDVKAIADNSDEIMIMAYDFHKSRGNPGPNFPLGGKDKYGYDFARLIEQFSDVVPQRKLTVIFGYFGYDWIVDEKRNMVEHGDPLSYNQIAARFITDCEGIHCKRTRDEASSESYITYEDTDGKKHIVWFEDQESVAKKQEFLQTKGISSYSYWAHSYY